MATRKNLNGTFLTLRDGEWLNFNENGKTLGLHKGLQVSWGDAFGGPAYAKIFDVCVQRTRQSLRLRQELCIRILEGCEVARDILREAMVKKS